MFALQMKCLVFVTAIVLAIAAQAVAALACSTEPSVKLIPLSPVHVAALGERPGRGAPAKVDDVFFEMPAIAGEEGVSGIAQVKIDLTAAGNIGRRATFRDERKPVARPCRGSIGETASPLKLSAANVLPVPIFWSTTTKKTRRHPRPNVARIGYG